MSSDSTLTRGTSDSSHSEKSSRNDRSRGRPRHSQREPEIMRSDNYVCRFSEKKSREGGSKKYDYTSLKVHFHPGKKSIAYGEDVHGDDSDSRRSRGKGREIKQNRSVYPKFRAMDACISAPLSPILKPCRVSPESYWCGRGTPDAYGEDVRRDPSDSRRPNEKRSKRTQRLPMYPCISAPLSPMPMPMPKPCRVSLESYECGRETPDQIVPARRSPRDFNVECRASYPSSHTYARHTVRMSITTKKSTRRHRDS